MWKFHNDLQYPINDDWYWVIVVKMENTVKTTEFIRCIYYSSKWLLDKVVHVILSSAHQVDIIMVIAAFTDTPSIAAISQDHSRQWNHLKPNIYKKIIHMDKTIFSWIPVSLWGLWHLSLNQSQHGWSFNIIRFCSTTRTSGWCYGVELQVAEVNWYRGLCGFLSWWINEMQKDFEMLYILH